MTNGPQVRPDLPVDWVPPPWWFKFVRAQEHRDALDAASTAYAESDLRSSVTRLLDSRDEWVPLVWEGIRQPDPMWGTYLGDALHDAKAALDTLMWNLVLVSGGTPGTHTHFPVCATPREWRKEVTARAIRRGLPPTDGLSEAAVSWLESVQPYERCRRNFHRAPLPRLVTLNNRDKYRLLRIAGLRLGKTLPRPSFRPTGFVEVLDFRGARVGTSLTPGTELGRARVKVHAVPDVPLAIGIELGVIIEFIDDTGSAAIDTPGLNAIFDDVALVLRRGTWLYAELAYERVWAGHRSSTA